MARFARVLSVTKSSSTAIAEPPEEAVNLESDFVVIMAALLCALICVVGLIAVARCARLRRSTNTTPTTNSRGASAPSASRAAAANKGLKKKVLQALPKFTYTAAAAPDSNTKFASSECAICLGEFAEGEEIRVLPQCGHGFHVGCIDTWLGSHSSCPSCRQILVVAKCQKCGQAELKARQQEHVIVNNDTNSTDSNSNNNDNNNSNVSSSSGSNVYVVTFLP